MKYLAKFISGDGLTKIEYVPRMTPNLYRVYYPVNVNLTFDELGAYHPIRKKEYQMLEYRMLNKDTLFIVYREVDNEKEESK